MASKAPSQPRRKAVIKRTRERYHTRATIREDLANLPIQQRPEQLAQLFPHYSPPPRPRQRRHSPHWLREENLEDNRRWSQWIDRQTRDIPDFPDNDDPDIFGLGEPAIPIDYVNSSHVERQEGGFSVFYVRGSEEDEARKAVLKKKKEERRRRERNGGLGAQRRRWVWKHGKAGGKGKHIAGPERRRGRDGRFLGRGNWQLR